MASNLLDGEKSAAAGKPRYDFSFKVVFPTLPLLDGKPQSIRLIERQYKHDILKINFDSVSPVYFELLKSGVPVKVMWNHGSDKRSWYGYVNFVTKSVSSQKLQPMTITCLGPTYPFKDQGNRVFPNSTVSEAVKTVVEEQGFRFIGDPSNTRYPQLVIAGHSYWEWLVEMAHRTGFGIWVDGTDFHFRDVTALVNKTAATAPVLALGNQNVATFQQKLSPTLDTFEPMLGDYIEGTSAARAVKNTAGVDPLTMTPHFSSASPSDLSGGLRAIPSADLFAEYRTGDVSNSAVSSATAATSASSLALFNIPAKASAMGNPLVHPFGAVYLRNTGTDTDGYWMVKEAEHIIRRTGGDYTLLMSLATDGIGDTATSPFRSSTPAIRGSVHIANALSQQAQSLGPIGSNEPVLTTLAPSIGVANQGYLRTPSRWVAPRRS
jgi:phage protein D